MTYKPHCEKTQFQTRSDTNQAVQKQRIAGGLKFWFEEEERLYYLYTCSENKGADQLRSYCAFVFAFAKAGFLTTRLIC